MHLIMFKETLTHGAFKLGIKRSFSGQLTYDYEEAVRALNSLQSNAAAFQEAKKRSSSRSSQLNNIEQTKRFLTRSGVSVDRLESELSVIHVSGTKGKGSTCAYCESILRCHGYKTGFFSSPHLVAVRERIRIDGRPLSQADFTRHFWDLYRKLEMAKADDTDMPSYFKFLTVMALNVFLVEKVDVAVIEVGIGGEYDCTNVLRRAAVVGITSLGLDHTSVLGDTIEAIAWQKAGIMKPGATVITALGQPEAALRVLRQRATERQCVLLEAPSLNSYTWPEIKVELRLAGMVQHINASLALQLANAWMAKARRQGGEYESDALVISEVMAEGLHGCIWPGRNQTIVRGPAGRWRYFVDGAHTPESIDQCIHWFMQATSATSSHGATPRRLLLFNATGDRNSSNLLAPLLACRFDCVIFCPNVVTMGTQLHSDLTNMKLTHKAQLERCETHRALWSDLVREQGQSAEDAGCKKALVCETVMAALRHIEAEDNRELDILVTGSMLLVGSVLSVLDPQLALSNPPIPVLGTDVDSDTLRQIS